MSSESLHSIQLLHNDMIGLYVPSFIVKQHKLALGPPVLHCSSFERHSYVINLGQRKLNSSPICVEIQRSNCGLQLAAVCINALQSVGFDQVQTAPTLQNADSVTFPFHQVHNGARALHKSNNSTAMGF